MARGWARARDAKHLHIIEPDTGRRAAFASMGFGVAEAVSAETPAADVFVLAVKPTHIASVAEAVSAHRVPVAGAVVLSIAAGVTLSRLSGLFPEAQVVRAMPNTAAEIGQSITVWVAGADIRPSASGHVIETLSTLGRVERAPDEAAMDAVTALSGSGPAYVYALTEALAAAGEAEGLPADLAARLARETLVGAGAMLAARADPPAALRAAVTSPAGTTAAGLSVLTSPEGLPDLIRRTVAAAAARSRALGAAGDEPGP